FPTTTFQDYMVPGAVLLSGMMMAGFAAVGVAEDRRNGFTDRLHLLGMSRAAVTIGRLLFDAVRVLPAAIGAYTLALFLGHDFGFDPLDAVALLVYGALWTMAYNAPFHLFAHRSANPHAPIAMQPLFAVLTFPSTFWFPGKLMPGWGEAMTGGNPVSWLTDGARVFTTPGTDVAAVALGLAVIAGTTALFLGPLHFSKAES
ncbi:MAG: ABC transporter permease, partial [Acidimicrobiales bacterium]